MHCPNNKRKYRYSNTMIEFVFINYRKHMAYPPWPPPYISPCDDRISASSSLSFSSQDTDCINPLLYGPMNHKLEDDFSYPMISSFYQTSQAKVSGTRIHSTRMRTDLALSGGGGVCLPGGVYPPGGVCLPS